MTEKQVEELAKEVSVFFSSFGFKYLKSQAKQNCRNLAAFILDRQEKREMELVEALKKHGDHFLWCASMRENLKKPFNVLPCDCGLREILNRYSVKPKALARLSGSAKEEKL